MKQKKNEILSGEYLLTGAPVPWARTGYARGTFYDTQKAIKAVLRSQIREQHQGRRLYEGPIEMNIIFMFEIPQSAKEERTYHHIRPDLDNMAKILMDICSGILYRDDCQIAQMFKKKIYGNEARTEFTIKELE